MNTRTSNNNNEARLAGEVISDYVYEHSIHGESFYIVRLRSPRLSSMADEIPLMVSERLVDISESPIGRFIEARGEFRSMNKIVQGENRLILRLFVKEIEDYEAAGINYPNHIRLDGFLCRKPVFRMTPGGREITDIMLAVHRGYGKTDYLPCILWGRNARFGRHLSVGSRLLIDGRIQSRIYQKRVGEDDYVERETYEVSVNFIKNVEEEERRLYVAETAGAYHS